MGIKREEMMDLIDTRNPSPSLTYWATVLDFFRNNQDHLDKADMLILCAESERCREYANADRTETITIFRNGHEEQIERTIRGFGITKESVGPNPYEYLEKLKEEERKAQEAEVVVEKPPVKKYLPAPGAIPLAAAPG